MTKAKDAKISILARECTFKVQGFAKPSKRTTIVERPANDGYVEMSRLRKIGAATPDAAWPETSLSAMGRFLPALDRHVLCFYCLQTVTVQEDRLQETVQKSRVSPGTFTACCSKCYQNVFVL
jgi:hypothetical protein